MEDHSSSGSDVPPALDDAAFVDMGPEQEDVDMEDAEDIEAHNIPSSSEDSMLGNLGSPPQSPLVSPGADIVPPGQPDIVPNPQPNANPRRFFRRVLVVGCLILLLLFILLVPRDKNHHELPPSPSNELPPSPTNELPLAKIHECNITISVSKNENSSFRTVSEAVDAAPANCPLRVCIFVGAGEYNERVVIGHEKINLLLLGEGTEKTLIASNETRGLSSAVLWVAALNFTAQDLTILSTAENGLAVENWASQSVFSQCNLRGMNATLDGRGRKQFYRSCNLYGRSYIVSGTSAFFFQKCNLSIETHSNETSVFVGQYGKPLPYLTGSIFHHCGFRATGSSSNSSQVFLGSALEDFASIALVQSYIDAPITGYFLSSTHSNTSYFAVFNSSGTTPTTTSVSPYVHVLSRTEAESRFSLESYLNGDNWIPAGVGYDLHLAR